MEKDSEKAKELLLSTLNYDMDGLPEHSTSQYRKEDIVRIYEKFKESLSQARSEGYENGHEKGYEDGLFHARGVFKNDVIICPCGLERKRGWNEAIEAARKVAEEWKMDTLDSTKEELRFYRWLKKEIAESINKLKRG